MRQSASSSNISSNNRRQSRKTTKAGIPAASALSFPALNGGACRASGHESESRNASYWNISDKIKELAPHGSVGNDQRELFGRMVFNVLVSNDDDHLRNHAFLWNDVPKGWALSPLYDVVPRASHAYERTLHLSVGTSGRLATLDNALSGCDRFGLSLLEGLETIEKIWGVTREWKNYFEEFGVSGRDIEKIAAAFRHIDDVLQKEFRRTSRPRTKV